ncbi:hypothetical protein [Streptomyces niveus]|uniref:hypothetical protein n=1 Tax=Streptomyces niveus TaxID=193462 RepID=UPI003443E56B
MKHTYLYPLPDDALFLWRAGRTSASDLFGHPPVTADVSLWTVLASLDEQFSDARDAVMRLIVSSDRRCIGQGYTIPWSLDPDTGAIAGDSSVDA